ncbi:hypothetical protein [Methylobacterium sp. CM6246]
MGRSDFSIDGTESFSAESWELRQPQIIVDRLLEVGWSILKMSFRSLLTASLVLGGLVAGTAAVQAAPALPQSGLTGHDMIDQVAMHHRHDHRMHRHHSTRHQRRMRRMNTMHHGNPNSKNPSRPGYQQNLGSTTGGPRY